MEDDQNVQREPGEQEGPEDGDSQEPSPREEEGLRRAPGEKVVNMLEAVHSIEQCPADQESALSAQRRQRDRWSRRLTPPRSCILRTLRPGSEITTGEAWK